MLQSLPCCSKIVFTRVRWQRSSTHVHDKLTDEKVFGVSLEPGYAMYATAKMQTRTTATDPCTLEKAKYTGRRHVLSTMYLHQFGADLKLCGLDPTQSAERSKHTNVSPTRTATNRKPLNPHGQSWLPLVVFFHDTNEQRARHVEQQSECKPLNPLPGAIHR